MITECSFLGEVSLWCSKGTFWCKILPSFRYDCNVWLNWLSNRIGSYPHSQMSINSWVYWVMWDSEQSSDSLFFINHSSLVSQQLLYWAEVQQCVGSGILKQSQKAGDVKLDSSLDQLIHVSWCFCSPLLKSTFLRSTLQSGLNAKHDGSELNRPFIRQVRSMWRFSKRAVRFVFAMPF